MPVANKLQDSRNQQKRLAEIITSKGIAATATEKYKSLVDKVAKIEELKGEEKVLENFTNIIDEPKSIVQLEYPIDNITVPPYVGITVPSAGITTTINSDNSVTFTGTATANTGFNFKNISTLSAGDYTFSAICPTGCHYTLGAIKTFPTNIGNATVTVTAATSNSYFLLSIPQGTVLNNVTIKQPTLFKIPENKTLNAKLGSKNLFDSSTQSVDMSINANTGVVSNAQGYTTSDYIPVSKTTYIINYCRIIAFYDANKNFIRSYDPTSTIKYTFTINDETQYIRFAFSSAKTNVQMELGSTATTYTPYISDFSTVNVTRRGKNLIPYQKRSMVKDGITFAVNSDGSINVSGTSTKTTGEAPTAFFIVTTDNPLILSINSSYTLSGFSSGTDNCGLSLQTTSYTSTHTVNSNTPSKTFTANFATWYVWIYVNAGATVNAVFNPQLELGTAATEYEPCQGQSYTPTSSGEVTGITNLYPLTTLVTDNAGALFTEVTGGVYKEILPSEGKNGITKIWQPAVEETVVCDYSYDETTKTLTLLL